MRRSWAMRRTLLAALILVVGAPPARAQEPEPSAVRQTEFALPFRLAAPADASQQPVEVQLRSSGDHGLTWQISARVKPTDSRFVFKAPHDGDYWFCIRTVDRKGIVRPETPEKPELRVIVDTTPPRLDLKATRGASGEITAHWQAVDQNLKPDTLAIEYQSGPNQPWERVAIEPGVSHTRQALTGEATWWPKAAGPISVRAQIADRAGNPALSHAQVSADPQRDPAGHVDPGPLADGAGPVGPPAAGAAGQMTSASPMVVNPPNTVAPADSASLPPQSTPQTPFRLSSSTDNLTRSNSSSGRSDGGRSEPFNAGAGGSDAGGNIAARLDALPPGERPRMINTRRFELEYDVESVGPSGIAKVELWGTTDGGKTWRSFGVDNDNRSPLVVNVPGEGLYGFTIVFQNGNGFGGYAPREGDAPEIWVGIDLTAPAAKIISAEIGRDNGELIVRWLAQDDMLDPRPISLCFSDRPTGPWSAIAAGLENLGQYSWRLDNRVPDRIYLRLDVRDEAGNIGQFVSPEPVTLALERPQGRIRGVRPVTPTTGSLPTPAAR